MVKLKKMFKSKKTKIINARKINQMRCIAGLVICSIVFVLTLVALILNIIDFFNDIARCHIGRIAPETALHTDIAFQQFRKFQPRVRIAF